MTNPIQTSAMLASLNISMWTARKYDKRVSAQVEEQHQAKDAGRFNKVLVAKEALEAISKTSTAARSYHYKMTLPWGDNGERLLPATLFMDYRERMRELRETFNADVSAFVRDYPQLRVDAVRRLGSMYNPLDYPDVTDIRNRFDMSLSYMPVPTSNDFRVNLNEEYVQSIRADIEQLHQQRQSQAMKDCYQRVREVVSHIHERLVDKDKTFRDTLIGNAQELLDVLPALNITGDPKLTGLAEEMRTMLVAPDRLRQDVGLRNETAERAAAILAKFDFS